MIEGDEICLRQSPALWLWIGISRKVGHVLGFDLGDRTDAALPRLWKDVAPDYQSKAIDTDGWGAYARFFASVPCGTHTVCDKGSGRTSRIEAFNTKCRQRQSAIVRRSCGTWTGITDDIVERFTIFAERHNRQCFRKWEARQKQQATMLTDP